jgi:hypothetical protein
MDQSMEKRRDGATSAMRTTSDARDHRCQSQLDGRRAAKSGTAVLLKTWIILKLGGGLGGETTGSRLVRFATGAFRSQSNRRVGTFLDNFLDVNGAPATVPSGYYNDCIRSSSIPLAIGLGRGD